MITKPFNHNGGLSQVIRHFTPNWFAAVMGTGITAICLNTLQSSLIEWHFIATYVWFLNIIIFVILLSLLVAKTTLYPESWVRMLKNSVQPMFLSCIPMGMATIINGFIFFGIKIFGNIAIDIAIFLWWIDVLMSIICIVIVPYFMFKHHEHNLKNMTAVWALPFVACNVAALSGAILLPYMPIDTAFAVFILNIVLWSISICLALGILVILFQRLALHQLPPIELASTMWLPLGPTGTGSLAIFMLGKSLVGLHFVGLSAQYAGFIQGFYVLSMFIALALWSFGTWWLIIAFLVTLSYIRKQVMSFNLGFWGYTFPFGSYIMATVYFARTTGFSLLKSYSEALIYILAIIWLAVFVRTLFGAYRGYLFKDNTIE